MCNKRARSPWHGEASETSTRQAPPRSSAAIIARACSSLTFRPQRIITERHELNEDPGEAKNGDLDFIGVYSFYGAHISNAALP